jgi:hypothetical protein
MKAYGEGGERIKPYFLDLCTSWEWSISHPGRFTSGERGPGTHWIEGVGYGDHVNVVEKRTFFPLPGLELQPLFRPARSQLLYRLLYPGS